MTREKYKPPRMIQARHLSFNIKYGRFIKPLETVVTKQSKYKHCFGKGDYDEVASRIMKHKVKYKYYTELDHDSFDAHVTTEMLEMTHNYYVACYPNYEKEIRNLANKTIVNKCKTRTGDKYVVRGTRMSGDVDTSFGNSLINYAIIKQALSILQIKGDVIVNGDDSIIFSEKPLGKEFADLMIKFNMVSKIKPSLTSIHSVEFCRTKLVINNLGNYTMLMDPERIESVYGMTYKSISSYKKYLKETAYCNSKINKATPLGAFWGKLYEGITRPPERIDYIKDISRFTQVDRNLVRVALRELHTEESSDEITQSMIEAYPSIITLVDKLERHIRRLNIYFSLYPDYNMETLRRLGYVKWTMLVNHATKTTTQI